MKKRTQDRYYHFSITMKPTLYPFFEEKNLYFRFISLNFFMKVLSLFIDVLPRLGLGALEEISM